MSADERALVIVSLVNLLIYVFILAVSQYVDPATNVVAGRAASMIGLGVATMCLVSVVASRSQRDSS